jgi:hypothetical protein
VLLKWQIFWTLSIVYPWSPVRRQGLALSNGPNRVGVLFTWWRRKTLVCETSCVFYQGYTMDNVQKVCHFNFVSCVVAYLSFITLNMGG